jgi:hypothetical protein
VPLRTTKYSVDPDCRSSDTVAVEPTKLPLDVPCRMNAPLELVAPWPEMVEADGFIWPEPDEIVYVVEPTTTFPAMESVKPWVRLPVTVKTTDPDAVPFSVRWPTTMYWPDVLVKVIVCPTETSARPKDWPNPWPPMFQPPPMGPGPFPQGPGPVRVEEEVADDEELEVAVCA